MPQRVGLFQRYKRAAVLIIFAAALAFPLSLRADDEFKALPGLWETTLLNSDSKTGAVPVVMWHCVYEGADPWASFAFVSATPDKSCKRTYSYRTSTSLKWRFECKSSSTITNQGSVIFTAGDHYTGKVELRGTLMGFPIDQTIMVEGKRRAACTSPQD